MPGELPDMRYPRIGEQLEVLSPQVKVVAGAVIMGLGIAGLGLGWGSFYGWVLFLLAMSLGIPLSVFGRAEWRDAQLFEAEMDRAKAELAALRPEVEAAVREKRSVDRVLRGHGFLVVKVRRWIALECGVVRRSR